MAKPNEAHQKWLDRNPCAMCGKALNKPFGRERSSGEYIVVQRRGSGGGRRAHKAADALPRNIHIGLCCIDKLTQGLNQ